MNRVYCHTNEISDIRIIESLLSVALYHCNNNYCFIVHSSVLLEHGFRVSDVQELMDLFELPDDIPESYKWSSIVRLTYFSFKDRVLMPDNFRKIRRFLSEEENSDFSVIMAYANFLFFMLYTFYDEIQITNEMLLQDPSISLETFNNSVERCGSRSKAAAGSRVQDYFCRLSTIWILHRS